MVKFLDLQKQYKSIEKEVNEKIFEVINDTAFIGGKYLDEFEKNFAAYCDIKHCIGVGNGTDALEIALWSLDLPKGSEVLVPANSFIATSEAVTRNGLKVKFVDCDEYYQMCSKSLKDNISDNTSAVIIVHLYGHPANMDAIVDIVEEQGLKLLEDCAQAHGAKYKNQRIGTFGDVATFSFYPGKNLGAYGDGGAIITNSDNLESKCRQYSNHGRSSKFGHEVEGINSRLDGLQAGILTVKLKYLDQWIKRRQEIADYYLENINNEIILLPKVNQEVNPVWHLFVIQTQYRDKVKLELEKNNIQSGIHYPVALPKLKAYDYLTEDYSTYKSCNEDSFLLSLPIGEHLSTKEIEYVVQIINSIDL